MCNADYKNNNYNIKIILIFKKKKKQIIVKNMNR